MADLPYGGPPSEWAMNEARRILDDGCRLDTDVGTMRTVEKVARALDAAVWKGRDESSRHHIWGAELPKVVEVEFQHANGEIEIAYLDPDLAAMNRIVRARSRLPEDGNAMFLLVPGHAGNRRVYQEVAQGKSA